MGLYDFTVYDVICRNAFTFKNKPAFFEVDDSRTLTFYQYKQTVDKVAAGLFQLGVRKGDRIGVFGKNSLEYFFIYGAAAAIGAIVLPINWRLSANEVVYNLNDGTPTTLFVDPEYHGMILECKTKLPSIKHFYSLKDGNKDFIAFNSLIDHSGSCQFPDISSDDGYVIIHTAAVAGKPRGALLTHGNVICANMHFKYYFNLTPDDVHLNMLPLFHVAGLFMAMQAFHAGALNINMSKFDAAKAVSLIQEKKVSVLFDFAPILSAILDQQEKTGADIRSLRNVMGIDVKETIEKYQKVTGGTFYCMYGQTETSCLATVGKYNDRPGSAGRIIQVGDVRLVDDHDNPVPIGQVGEIVLKGPMVFKGYWNLPEDTQYTFRNGWHHTGDTGRFDEDGFLFYAGRKPEKELIKPGGENVYPAEVENVILEHPAVAQCMVFGVPDPKWKEGIKAVCVLKEGMSLQPEELIKFVGSKIASYKKPQYVQFISAFPLKPDGTIDRVKVKELYGGEQK